VKTSIRAVGGSSGPAKDAIAASVPEYAMLFSLTSHNRAMNIPNEKAPLPSAFGNGPIWISMGRMSVALRPSFRAKFGEEVIL
jgi:hypothetical protein